MFRSEHEVRGADRYSGLGLTSGSLVVKVGGADEEYSALRKVSEQSYPRTPKRYTKGSPSSKLFWAMFQLSGGCCNRVLKA